MTFHRREKKRWQHLVDSEDEQIVSLTTKINEASDGMQVSKRKGKTMQGESNGALKLIESNNNPLSEVTTELKLTTQELVTKQQQCELQLQTKIDELEDMLKRTKLETK